MPSPTNDVSQHAPASMVSAHLTGPPLRLKATEISRLVASFKSNAQDPARLLKRARRSYAWSPR